MKLVSKHIALDKSLCGTCDKGQCGNLTLQINDVTITDVMTCVTNFGSTAAPTTGPTEPTTKKYGLLFI